MCEIKITLGLRKRYISADKYTIDFENKYHQWKNSYYFVSRGGANRVLKEFSTSGMFVTDDSVYIGKHSFYYLQKQRTKINA